MITQAAFFDLPEVKAEQRAEATAKSFGDKQHRDAHRAILHLAEAHGVSEYFESLADYDESVRELGI